MATTLTEMKAAAQPKSQQELAAMRPKDKIAYLLDSKKAEIAKMLPKHLNAERLLKVAQIAATTTPALLECDVPSLIGCIAQCALMGLEPNTVLGHAYLVPFNTKRKDNQGNEKWVKSVQVIIGYKGLIDLARRSGQIVSIAAHEVCSKDHFELVYGLEEKLEHKPALSDRGNVIGFYAVAKLKDGGYSFEFMSKHEIDQIMKASQSKGKYGPWADHYTEMGRKTVIRRLAKYLPLSIEFQTAVALDGAAESGRDQQLDAQTIDGEFSAVPDDEARMYGAASDEPGAIENNPSDTLEMPATRLQEAVQQRQQPADQQRAAAPQDAEDVAATRLLGRIRAANDLDTLDVDADLIGSIQDAGMRAQLQTAYRERREQLEAIATPPTQQPAAASKPAGRAGRAQMEIE